VTPWRSRRRPFRRTAAPHRRDEGVQPAAADDAEDDDEAERRLDGRRRASEISETAVATWSAPGLVDVKVVRLSSTTAEKFVIPLSSAVRHLVDGTTREPPLSARLARTSFGPRCSVLRDADRQNVAACHEASKFCRTIWRSGLNVDHLVERPGGAATERWWNGRSSFRPPALAFSEAPSACCPSRTDPVVRRQPDHRLQHAFLLTFPLSALAATHSPSG
jgi:hypothetical protein